MMVIMKTIAFIGQKGGTGKTTLASALAVAFESDGIPTRGIDLDPQASLAGWSDDRGAFAPEVVVTVAPRLQRELDAAARAGAQVCLIDTAGRAEESSMAAVKAADLVIIPMQPSAADLKTAASVLNTIKLGGNPPHFAVLTRVKTRGSRADEARQFLEGQGIKVCPYEISDRVTFQDATASGMAPQEFEPSGRAAEECRHVYEFSRQKIEM
ncbi:ParA family protein (plasmid) [Acuticoccus sp. MNP-M23]|uniref:ParA family protein n=1 Tax=Acuticoccus sp. MNP-M23 TaxID=3072793 RepID=UPI002814C317|nr:ParA family protein [Acuticoccus sp. MNP-M23]WMS45376.1 ParA family protein [Acuticoccus sp. MNP-M23]